MPARRRPAYKKKRSAYQKRRSKYAKRNQTVVRGLITSDSKFVALPLSVSFTQDPAAASSATTIIAANDCYDPTLTLGAYQPLGFDQHMAFYNHFICIKSQIFISAMSTGTTTSTNAAVITCTLRGDSVAVTDWEEIQASPKQRRCLLNNANGKGVGTIKFGYAMSKFFGQKVIGDNQFEGSVAASPDEGSFWHITTSPFNPASDVTSVYFNVRVVYHCLLRERKDLTESAA